MLDKYKFLWAVFAAFMSLVGLISGITIALSMNEAELRAVKAEHESSKRVLEIKMQMIEKQLEDVNYRLDAIAVPRRSTPPQPRKTEYRF